MELDRGLLLLDGDDLVYGGGLADQVFGGKGDDLLIAGAVRSLLDGVQ